MNRAKLEVDSIVLNPYASAKATLMEEDKMCIRDSLKEFKADIAMVINLSPDHLSRYKSEQEYFDAKFNIGKNQTEDVYKRQVITV